MRPAKSLPQRLLAYALCASLACPLPARAGLTDIANTPVTQPATTSMQPNILLILDDSGSMERQFTPDFVSLTSTNCYDSFDSSNDITNTPSTCWAGDVPSMSPDFNSQYYNPEFRYRPAVDYTGIERNSMSCANTGGVVASGVCNPNGWTAVPTDSVSAAGVNQVRKNVHSSWDWNTGSTVTTLNLLTEFPDRVWCSNPDDPATDTALCKTNSSYTYPSAPFAYGLIGTTSARKYKFGAPYYYRIVVKEYCTDARMNDCLPICVSLAPNLPAGCIVSNSAPDNVVSGKSYAVPAPVRFCTDSTLTDCHAKRSSTRTYAKYLGAVSASASVVPPVAATATIILGREVTPATSPPTYTSQPDAQQGNVTSIVVTKVDGTVIQLRGPAAGGSFTLTGGDSNNQWADTIESRIDAQTGTAGCTPVFGPSCTGFSATSPSQTGPNSNSGKVIISAPDNSSLNAHPAASFNGASIAITTNVTATSPASFTWTISNTASTTCGAGPTTFNCGAVSSLQVDGQEMVSISPIKCTAANCTSTSGTGSGSVNRNNAMALAIFSGITPPAGWVKSQPATNQVRVTAPLSTFVPSTPPFGSAMNGRTATSIFNSKVTLTANGTLSGGSTTGDVVTASVSNFSGGQNETPAGAQVRSNAGTFERVNIVPGLTYNVYPDRSDCVAQANVCTYEEEMTNFANWFSYYRSRLHMAKTSIGRAFALAGIGDNFRVGFMTINFATAKYLAVAPFVTGAGAQKDLWFQRLYATPTTSGTPLRIALSRAGQYFGDRNPSVTISGVVNSTGPSPINSACQPNYTILTSDGYWNESESGATKDLAGNAIIDVDGDGRTNTLADVAYYYYNTDLLPTTPLSPSTLSFKNQVPPSGDDTAPHQHMTTFTVGMGVSGQLLFHPNYLTPGNSLDYDAIVGSAATTTPTVTTGGASGSSLWPTPVNGQETTVDDMWHAAVNGRGRFFSAQNPVALAAGINEVLTAVQKRVGAGAAAATSNLQPVAGDNFAFTAQYQTVEWSGDLKARTISLTDGVVGERELWSAQAQLDLRTFGDRVIYTYDAADADPAATVAGLDGNIINQNANKLRSFCRPGAGASTYPTCTDGGLITDAERVEHFDPLGGPNGALGQAAGWLAGDPRIGAAQSFNNTYLFRFLRGERAREIVIGSNTSSDLFRTRTSILGDIVNAQPAYVKSSPFSYSAATDPYYTTFQATTNGQSATRTGTVYVAANDGMLHAFETDPDNIPYYQNAGVSPLGDLTNDTFTGTLNTDPIAGEGAERWAYIPQLVFPTLKRLAEESYPTNHKFFTDGSPAIGDVCFGHTLSTPCSSSSSWRTILVAGLNAGGRGYYALDITLPNSPKGLWEVAGGSQALVSGSVKCLTDAEANSGLYNVDCNIGYSFGNPIIAKRPIDGKWVVFFTSGYNNVNYGSGLGYLYMVDAQTGKILRRMSTGAGCAVTDNPDGACLANVDDPSGLARINAWVDSATTDNTAKAVYGGDLLGNLWRFQLDDTAAVPRYSVTRLATVEGDGNVVQPITVRPDLATVNSNRVVYFGTGKFLGSTDKLSLVRQSIYAIKDDMSGAASPQINMVRPSAGTITGFVKQVLTEDTTSTRTVTTPQTVNFASDKGWFIDLPDGGTGEEAAERVNVDPIIQLGTLVVASNVPSTETCLAGGSGWINFLDIKTGAPITGATANSASVKISGSLVVGINIVKIGDQIKTIVTTADNQQLTKETPVAATGVTGRRVSWRELIVE